MAPTDTPVVVDVWEWATSTPFDAELVSTSGDVVPLDVVSYRRDGHHVFVPSTTLALGESYRVRVPAGHGTQWAAPVNPIDVQDGGLTWVALDGGPSDVTSAAHFTVSAGSYEAPTAPDVTAYYFQSTPGSSVSGCWPFNSGDSIAHLWVSVTPPEPGAWLVNGRFFVAEQANVEQLVPVGASMYLSDPCHSVQVTDLLGNVFHTETLCAPTKCVFDDPSTGSWDDWQTIPEGSCPTPDRADADAAITDGGSSPTKAPDEGDDDGGASVDLTNGPTSDPTDGDSRPMPALGETNRDAGAHVSRDASVPRRTGVEASNGGCACVVTGRPSRTPSLPMTALWGLIVGALAARRRSADTTRSDSTPSFTLNPKPVVVGAAVVASLLAAPTAAAQEEDERRSVQFESNQPLEVSIYFEGRDPETSRPIASCRTPCTLRVVPDEYEVHIAETDGSLSGTRTMTLDRPRLFKVTPKTSLDRYGGLALAGTGIAAVVGGAVMMSTGLTGDDDPNCNELG